MGNIDITSSKSNPAMRVLFGIGRIVLYLFLASIIIRLVGWIYSNTDVLWVFSIKVFGIVSAILIAGTMGLVLGLIAGAFSIVVKFKLPGTELNKSAWIVAFAVGLTAFTEFFGMLYGAFQP